ncbi:MAG: PTS system mannose/fructose/sorbose family transporter subunit IID [Gemmatimonadetes bacterium]|nr:PTS system mannose/fructose/sorbose family transporter subunit IID [Gemmatimonadota bacterium]
MTDFPAGTSWRVMLRSLFIQGSWNYETLIGTGFAFSLLPVLRYLHADDDPALREALARHAEIFNSHPYLANVAVGAVARLEAERVDPLVIVRFKSALRGSLGSLGDQLVWSAWRPAAALLGILLLLVGAVWWVAVGAFLLVYNALNCGLRVWGWRIGTTAGMNVGRAIREAPFQSLTLRATEIGSLLAGACVAFATPAAVNDPWAAGVNGAAVALGIWLGLRTRRAMAFALGVVVVIGIVNGLSK